MLKLMSIFTSVILFLLTTGTASENVLARSFYNPSIDNMTSGCILYERQLEIVFVLDTSSSINSYNETQVLQQQTEFIMDISKLVELDVGRTKISVLRFVDETNVVIRDSADHVTLQNALLQMTPQNASKQLNYTDVFPYVSRNVFSNHSAAYSKIIFLVTFTKLKTSDVPAALSDIKGITVYVLHMGNTTSPVCALTPHAYFFCKSFSSVDEISSGAAGLTLPLVASYGCDICHPNPCENGANCTNLNQNTDKSCSCVKGFYGPTCNIKDQCPNDPCNGQNCTMSISGEVVCGCTKFGYYGKYCQYRRPCSVLGCENGGNCEHNSTTLMTECNCLIGYYGEFCQYQVHCLLSKDLCKRNGTCSHNTTTHLSTCHCKYPYDGATCTQCACQNGGTCNDTSCQCTVNCEGQFCQNCIPYCDVVPPLCQNNGTCTSTSILEFSCDCQPECYGDRCQHCDYCRLNNPCQHGGSCYSTSIDTYTCECLEHCNGTNCENCSTYCEINPTVCENGGTCHDACNSNGPCSNYTCGCHSYCSGNHCQSCNDLPFCASNIGICNTGICVDSGGGGYICNCPVECDGQHCDNCTGYCTSHPGLCLNSGVCENTPSGSYQCICPTPCQGGNCETCQGTDSGFCDNNPGACFNGGTCYVTNHTGSYTVGCHCPNEYEGVLCENMDPCHFYSCFNNGTCLQHTSGVAVCVCDIDYTGENCEIPQSDPPNPCNSDPCMNHCDCFESCRHSMGYKCVGNQGYLGKNCEISPPTLKCDSSYIEVEIFDSFVKEMVGDGRQSYVTVGSTDQLRIEDPLCTSKSLLNGKRTITIPLPFTNCRNLITNSEQATIVSNEIWLNFDDVILKSGVQIDMPVPLGKFSCSYPIEYNITTFLRPVISSPVSLSGAFHYDPRIRLCNEQACLSPCTNGFQPSAIYTVGQRIYATVTTPNVQSGFVTSVDRLSLSCSSWTSSTNEIISLVENGCPTTYSYSDALSLAFSRNANDGTICLSFRTPNMRNCNQFYIHARLVVCEISQRELCTSTALYKCDSKTIFKRFIGVEKSNSLLVMGPIYSIKGSRGVSHFDVDYAVNEVNEDDNGDDSIENEPSDFLKTYIVLGLLAVLVTGSVFLTASALLCYRKRRHGA